MHKRFIILITIIIAVVITSCKSPIRPEDLAGKWNYVKVENPYSPNPPDTVSAQELADKQPYIRFSQNGVLLMMWGGKILSHGTYKIDNGNISYTEELPDGKTRIIPFWIKKLTDTEITFETKEDDAIRVTAKKER